MMLYRHCIKLKDEIKWFIFVGSDFVTTVNLRSKKLFAVLAALLHVSVSNTKKFKNILKKKFIDFMTILIIDSGIPTVQEQAVTAQRVF